jgi:hypothetical protein
MAKRTTEIRKTITRGTNFGPVELSQIEFENILHEDNPLTTKFGKPTNIFKKTIGIHGKATLREKQKAQTLTKRLSHEFEECLFDHLVYDHGVYDTRFFRLKIGFKLFVNTKFKRVRSVDGRTYLPILFFKAKKRRVFYVKLVTDWYKKFALELNKGRQYELTSEEIESMSNWKKKEKYGK